jgi:hypothetical protein
MPCFEEYVVIGPCLGRVGGRQSGRRSVAGGLAAQLPWAMTCRSAP